jgi:hypothetical protein
MKNDLLVGEFDEAVLVNGIHFQIEVMATGSS